MPRVCDGLKKPVVESARAIDVRVWHRAGLLRAGRSFPWEWRSERGVPIASIGVVVLSAAVLLSFEWRQRGATQWARGFQFVAITWTPLHPLPHRRPGMRCWFLCPAIAGNGEPCGRRVAKLYAGYSHLFGCRRCHALAYACQSETPRDRSVRRARKARLRLHGSASLLDELPLRPKGMHRETYNRLLARALTASLRWADLQLAYLPRRPS